jgi:hypothetical protein
MLQTLQLEFFNWNLFTAWPGAGKAKPIGLLVSSNGLQTCLQYQQNTFNDNSDSSFPFPKLAVISDVQDCALVFWEGA